MSTPESDCLGKAISLLSKTSYSKRRLSDKLSAAYNPMLVEHCIQELENLGYLNEREDCQIWLNHYLLSKKSKKEIYYSLLKRGYDKDLISDLLQTVTAEREIQNALLLLKSTKPILTSNEKAYEKLFTKLLRKGFSTETVRTALKTLTNCEIESDFYEKPDSLS